MTPDAQPSTKPVDYSQRIIPGAMGIYCFVDSYKNQDNREKEGDNGF